MRQLVRVDDRVDAGDLTVLEIERQHPEHRVLPVEEEHARTAVDVDVTQRHTRDASEPAGPVAGHRASDPAAAAHRPGKGWSLTAAVRGQPYVMSKQRLQPGEIALLGGREEPSGQLVALLARRLESRSPLLDVASGPSGELAYV